MNTLMKRRTIQLIIMIIIIMNTMITGVWVIAAILGTIHRRISLISSHHIITQIIPGIHSGTIIITTILSSIHIIHLTPTHTIIMAEDFTEIILITLTSTKDFQIPEHAITMETGAADL